MMSPLPNTMAFPLLPEPWHLPPDKEGVERKELLVWLFTGSFALLLFASTESLPWITFSKYLHVFISLL